MSGQRVAIDAAPFVLGRDRTASLQVEALFVSRRHCAVVCEHGRWWVRDLGSTMGTWVRGERVADAELEHGDWFELPWGHCFRLLLREPVVARDADLERAIVETDDPRVWSVYADRLLEQGDPLGARLAMPRADDDARWLGPLAGLSGRGELSVGWAHGLPRTAVLRSVSGSRAELSWDGRLTLLQRHREFRFLRELVLDLGSFSRDALTPALLVAAFDALDGSLAALERLQVGPATASLSAPEVIAAASAVKARHPRLARASELLLPWRPASLEVLAVPPDVALEDAAPRALVTPFRVGPEGAQLVVRAAPPGVDFTLRFENDRWRFESAPATQRVFRHNGRVRAEGQLRDRDVLEPVAGLLFRFLA